MSLILEALKQADSERSEKTRGGASGVFSQTLTAPAAPPHTSSRRVLPWLLLTALATALLWFARPHLTQVESLNAANPTKPLTAPLLAETTAPIAVPPQPPAQAAAPSKAFPPTAPTLPPPSGALFRTEPAAAAPPVISDPATAPPKTTLSHSQNSAALSDAGPSAPSSAAPLLSAEQLPAEVRVQLPKLQITGHTYSTNPTLRMLMIDGHMVVEGQAIAPGLRLERIGPHQAIFNHRGTRFSLEY